MGGSSYDRDVYSGSSYSNWGSSNVSASKLSSSSLDPTMSPKSKLITSSTKNPIVIMLDVTGSNINFARLVYDKLPMFYGQIEEHNYLDDFDIAICAVGDAYTDDYPLQISDFAKGIELDAWMEKLVLEEGGGGQEKESYELAAYYLAKKMEFSKDARPLIFFIGDEAPYPEVNKNQAERFGIEYDDPQTSKSNNAQLIDGFTQLRKKVNDNVFMFLNPYCGRSFQSNITGAWNKALAPEHVVKISEEKAIVDLMLGVIATMAGKNMKMYAIDMKDRGQTAQRIAGVTASLNDLSNALVPIEQINTDLPVDLGKAKTYGSHNGRRI